MDLQLGIIILGCVQGLCLVALLGAGVALLQSGRRAKRAADSVRVRGERLRKAGMDARTAAVDRASRAVGTVKSLLRSLDQKWQTIRRLSREVAHPREPSLREAAGRVERTGRMADRLLRLRAAALKASGQQGPVRPGKS